MTPSGSTIGRPSTEFHALFAVRAPDPDLDRVAWPSGRQIREPVQLAAGRRRDEAGLRAFGARPEVERKPAHAVELLGPDRLTGCDVGFPTADLGDFLRPLEAGLAVAQRGLRLLEVVMSTIRVATPPLRMRCWLTSSHRPSASGRSIHDGTAPCRRANSSSHSGSRPAARYTCGSPDFCAGPPGG